MFWEHWKVTGYLRSRSYLVFKDIFTGEVTWCLGYVSEKWERGVYRYSSNKIDHKFRTDWNWVVSTWWFYNKN